MHILKINHGYPPNYNAGSEVYSQSICSELSKHHRVSVFTREENPYTPDYAIRLEKASENLDLYYVNNPNGKDGYRHKQLDKKFAKTLDDIRPDIAHVGHLNHLSTGIVDELNKQNIPIVFTLHDFWLMCPRGQFLTRSIGEEINNKLCTGQEDKKCALNCYKVYFSGKEAEEQTELQTWSNWIHNRMLETKAIVGKVNLFIAPSKYLRERFIEEFGMPENKIIYLDYGFPTEYLTPTEKTTEKKEFTFGYIGTHIPAKGVNLLIEAFGKIEQKAILKIFGRHNGQSTNALKHLAGKSFNRIEFEGEYINHNLANDVFSKVDCIVVPSIWAENSPLVIHEAQSCKIPVITADYGGMKEYVQHQVNGLLFEHRNVDSLKDQMEFAIKNQKLVNGLGERGYLFSNDGSVPTIKSHCKTLEDVYKGLIAAKNLWRITIDTNPEDCNINCVMCEEHSPYSDFIPKLFKTTGLKRRRMEFEIVEKLFAQAEKLGIKEIIPSTMGEPLLYKDFDKLCLLARNKNIKINLTTNGTFPKRSVTEWAKIIVPITSDVKISFNGATEKTTKEMMPGIDYEKTLSNIKEFIRFRNEYYNSTGYLCRVTFQLTFMQNNMHELADIVKLAAKLGVDRVKGHHLWAHFDEIKHLSMKATKESTLQWNDYVNEAYSTREKYRKPNGEKVILENIFPITTNESDEVPEKYECPFLTKELWVSATGVISPCCAPDKLRRTLGDFGNITNTSLEDVLKSATYNELVNNYKSKSLCKTCNMRKPIS